MRLLIDTHAFLQAVGGSGLSVTATQAFLDPANGLFLSAASYWEICIKISLGKLALAANWPQQFEQEMTANQIQWLPISKEHCQWIVTLPFLHGDPFDRLLVAQALCEDMTLLTNDANIRKYAAPTVW